MKKQKQKELARLKVDSLLTPRPLEGSSIYEGKFYKRRFNGSRWIREVINFFEPVRLVSMELKERLKILGKKAILKSRAEFKRVIPKLTPVDFLCGFIGLSAVFSSSLVFLSGFYLLGYQSVLWLKEGIWTEFPLLVAFDFIFKDTALQAWLSDPGSWFGLHRIALWALENVPLSLILIMDGALLILFLLALMTVVVFFRYYQIKKL